MKTFPSAEFLQINGSGKAPFSPFPLTGRKSSVGLCPSLIPGGFSAQWADSNDGCRGHVALLFTRTITEMIFLFCFRMGCAGLQFPFP